MTVETATKILEEHSGTSLEELLTEATYDSVSWGICMECGDTTACTEPDQRRGWCGECKHPAIISVLVLMDIL